MSIHVFPLIILSWNTSQPFNLQIRSLPILGNFFNDLFNYWSSSTCSFLIHPSGTLNNVMWSVLDMSSNSHIPPDIIPFLLFLFYSLTFKSEIYSVCFSKPNIHISTISILFLYKLFRLAMWFYAQQSHVCVHMKHMTPEYYICTF